MATATNSRIQSKTVDIGIDYLTLTSKDPHRFNDWKAEFVFAASEEQARGQKWVKARLLGYDGEQAGHIFLGQRNDGCMLRLTSAAAERYAVLFSPEASHCTRIDLQVTQELLYPAPDFLQKSYDYAKSAKLAGIKPPVYTHIKNSDGGGTLYAGSRSSMRFGRIYDKGVESGQMVPGKLLRWEVEIKDILADQTCAMLAAGLSYERTIYSILGDFFTARALPVIWSVPPMEQKFSVPRIAIEDSNTVRWLAGPVATAFARICETIGPEQALRAVFSKALTESSDSDIISEMAQMYTEHLVNIGR
jgi:DNA relaxase NicK